MANNDSNGFGIVKRPNGSRIRYVDPNDIYGDINGVPVTPDYTDYCIWCNLTVDKYSRIKSGANGQTSTNSTTYNFHWDATATKTDGVSKLSFMRGKQNGPDYNFLTTDYTEIDFNEVKQRNFIEGLGIESVSITMNNYYVPEVTINFVDIRGGGFFGREEATHDTFDLINLEEDQYGNLSDNFYSCFVSFPYPRFRLQIKGFYGRPVTYQLTCSNFTGTFDSSTGNFKLTAKFIGYFYGIMSDIPYEYLVAAPLCTYKGKEYWDKRVNHDDWKLDDDRPPIKLYDFYQLVSNAMQTTEGRAKLMGTADNDTLENYKTMATKLNTVKGMLNEFKSELKSVFPTNFECVTTNNSQLVLLSNTDKVKIPDRVCSRYNELVAILDEYAREFGSSYKTKSGETLDKSKRPGTQEDKWVSGETSLSEFFKENGGKLYCVLNNKDLSNTATSLKGLNLPTCSPSNGDMSKTTTLSEDISDVIKKRVDKYQDIIHNKKLYGCAIDFHRIDTTIGEIDGKLAIDLKRIENELSERQTQSIVEYFGFAPYVGNFFKIVMCHLETFVEIMYEVARNIDGQISEGYREPGKLGITNAETDVPSKLNFIPPWPAVYKNKPTHSQGSGNPDDVTTKYDTFGDDCDTRGWVGDAMMGSVEWEEKKMLMAMYNAVIKVIAPKKAEGTDLSASAPTIVDNMLPSIPSDLYTGVPSYASESKDMLAAYLGMRIMQIYALYNRGDVNERYANAFAMLDAYNFFKQNDCYAVKTLVTPSKGGTIGDELYDLMLAKETGHDNHLSYEFTQVVNDRHPIYVENGSNLTYSYMKTINGIPILPITVDNLAQNTISKYFKNNGEGKFTPQYDAQNNYSQLGNGFQYTGTTTNLLNNYQDSDSIKADYQNPSLFYAVVDDKVEILDRYREMLSTGNFSSGNDDLDKLLNDNQRVFSEFATKYWKTIEKDDYLLDNSIGTAIEFNLETIKDITPQNIKTRFGRRRKTS